MPRAISPRTSVLRSVSVQTCLGDIPEATPYSRKFDIQPYPEVAGTQLVDFGLGDPSGVK